MMFPGYGGGPIVQELVNRGTQHEGLEITEEDEAAFACCEES